MPKIMIFLPLFFILEASYANEFYEMSVKSCSEIIPNDTRLHCYDSLAKVKNPPKKYKVSKEKNPHAKTTVKPPNYKYIQHQISSRDTNGTLNVAYVINYSNSSHREFAETCVDSILSGYDRARCFVFKNMKDYRHADIDKKRGGMSNMCWVANYSKSKIDGRSSHLNTSIEILKLNKCPSAIRN